MTTLFRLKGFIPFVLVVFLNAFVDLGHKLVHRLVVLEGTCLFKKDRLAVASSQPVL